MKKTFLLLSILTVSFGAQASDEARVKHTVTGKSSYIHTGYGSHSNARAMCSEARSNAYDKAYDLCYRRGYDEIVRITRSKCKTRLVAGKYVKLKFFCK